jgi:exopolyphosphatase/pppGpp-phosphohydrolase
MQRAGVMMVLTMIAAACDRPASPVPTCAIDMGSNSFRRIVGYFADGRYVETRIEARTLGVGDDVEKNGRISEAKLAQIADTLAEFTATCEKEGAPNPVAIGTAAFRDAPNGAAVVAAAAKAGVTMEIATEARESELAYLVGSLGRDGYAVIDNGSRSIELVAREGGVRYLVFNLGYRIAYEQFFAKATDPAAAIAAFRERLLEQAAKAPFMKGRKTFVGVEFAEMAEILFPPAPTEGRVFTLPALQQRLNEIASQPGDFDRLKQTEDIDRALPRLVAAAVFAEAFGYSQIELTDRQLGAGLIIEAGLARP